MTYWVIWFEMENQRNNYAHRSSLDVLQWSLKDEVARPSLNRRRHIYTNRQVAGSIPDGDIGLFQWHNPAGRTMALGSTQPLTGMSTRCISWGKGGRCVRLTTLLPSCAVVMKSGNLNCLEPSGPLQACNETALPYLPLSIYSENPTFGLDSLTATCMFVTTNDTCVSKAGSPDKHIINSPPTRFRRYLRICVEINDFVGDMSFQPRPENSGSLHSEDQGFQSRPRGQLTWQHLRDITHYIESNPEIIFQIRPRTLGVWHNIAWVTSSYNKQTDLPKLQAVLPLYRTTQFPLFSKVYLLTYLLHGAESLRS
jgi:hypothetical protein